MYSQYHPCFQHNISVYRTAERLGKQVFITLLRKAGFACRPILGGELVFQLESASGTAVCKANQPLGLLQSSASTSAEENSSFQGVSRRNESVYTSVIQDKSLKTLASELLS